MPIERLKKRDLPEAERADLESALQDPARRRFEDRQIFVMLLVLAATWLMVAEVFLMYEVRKWRGLEGDPLQAFEGFFSALPDSLPLLWRTELLEFAGLVALPLAMAALIVHAWRTKKAWNGCALTSFGFVQVRGDSLRVLRYKDISEVRVRPGSEILHGRNSAILEVFDERGGSLALPGHGFEGWKDRIEMRRPAPKSLDDPGKSTQAPRSTPPSVTEEFARLHGFSMEELRSNRAGQIHPAQIARNRGKGAGCAVALGIYGLVSLLGAFLGAAILYLSMPGSGVDRGGFVGILLGGLLHGALFGGLGMLLWRKVAARRRLYERPTLGVVEGTLEKVHVRRTRRRGGDEYRYRIGERSFPVQRAAWEKAAQGARYRIYFVADDLLSLEPAVLI